MVVGGWGEPGEPDDDMRQPRIKVDSATDEAVYHCMTRVVNKERLFDDPAREILRRQLWLVAEYCGVEVLTYAILRNHFHVLVKVPRQTVVTDEELLRRYHLLYPRPTRYQTARFSVIRSQLASNGPEAVGWRRRQLSLMGDVSQYMKLLKQRFSLWFNQSHGRIGTLWCERFKSVLVEPRGEALRIIAAYIDLNLVRAGMVTDPKEGRFCGYAEAVAGSAPARRGIMAVTGVMDWNEAQAAYRQGLFGAGAEPREDKLAIRPEDGQRVIREGGQLPLAEVLRCRVRYFSDGAVLGSQAFVATHLARYRQRTGRREQAAPRRLPPVTDWGDLATLRGLRRNAFG
jgi:REP element-mobilizing transposase RayT